MKKLFVNPDEQRMRAVWRIIITTILIFSLVMLWAIFFRAQFAVTIGLAVIVMAVLKFASVAIDKRDFNDFGFNLNAVWCRDFFAGAMIAMLAMSAILIFLLLTGSATISLNSETLFTGEMAISALQMVVFMMAISVWEEAYFRSYLITNIQEGFHFSFMSRQQAVWFAVLVSSVIFGISHAYNPNTTWFSPVNITIAGLILAYPYIKTKSVAISVGMHLSWNYFQGIVFGMPVSGLEMKNSLATTEITGPEYITGGQFGPEGGAAGLLGLLLLAAACQLYLALFYKK